MPEPTIIDNSSPKIFSLATETIQADAHGYEIVKITLQMKMILKNWNL